MNREKRQPSLQKVKSGWSYVSLPACWMEYKDLTFPYSSIISDTAVGGCRLQPTPIFILYNMATVIFSLIHGWIKILTLLRLFLDFFLSERFRETFLFFLPRSFCLLFHLLLAIVSDLFFKILVSSISINNRNILVYKRNISPALETFKSLGELIIRGRIEKASGKKYEIIKHSMDKIK